MPRPPKCRRVEFEPQVTYFKPAGIPKHKLEELVLTVEELEAIRLKDREGLEQEICAERMNVSRATFQRVLGAARGKIAEAITEGKAIRVEGGHYHIVARCFKCHSCEETFEVARGTGRGCEQKCPLCGDFVHRV
ncbi:MAG: DUF134 domain-containing protein [Clostridiales bacterium]|jgi:predicted DNA-binding protein (UPF0251 family)|nr:DUF134 domain-containing protein [Clostridiales bacterium]